MIIGMLHSWVHNLGRGGTAIFGLCLALIFLISISVVFTQPGCDGEIVYYCAWTESE